MKKKVTTAAGHVEVAHSSIKQEFIRIPTDFTSLHDLKELVSNYDLVQRLTSALFNYNEHYIQSYFMTMDEVLMYIPEDQQKDYKLKYREDERDLNKSYEYKAHDEKYNDCGWRKNEKGKEEYYFGGTKTRHVPATEYAKYLPKNKESGDALLPLDVALNKLFKLCRYTDKVTMNKDAKIFMVDSINKKVEICPWNLPYNEKISYNFARINYTGKNDFDVDKDKNLIVKLHYIIHDQQARGGVWINGRSGYLSGEKYVAYTRNGCDHYAFCTRTNKFLGYVKSIEDRRRGWNE
jgi:hypothetical protein